MRARALYVAWNVPLTLALCCALVGVGVPRPLGAAVVVAPRQVPAIDASSAYFAGADAVYRTDLDQTGDVGDTTFRVARAVFVDSLGYLAPHGPNDEDGVDGSDYAALGDDESLALAATHRELADLTGWETVAELRWSTGPSVTRVTHSVGGDTVAFELPTPTATCAGVGGSGRSGMAVVDVNGFAVPIDLGRMHTGEVSADRKVELSDAWDRLDDPRGFARKSASLGKLLARTVDPGDVSTLRDPWACLECAAQLGVAGLTIVGMVTACGGPTMGWACVQAYIGSTIQEISALVSCYRCLAEDPPDGGDDERDDEDEDEDEDDDECSCTGIGVCDCL